MAVKLRLKRLGRSHRAFYRLHAVDARSPVDGRVIEELGFYDPIAKDAGKQFVVNLDRCKYWMDHGATPSGTVSSLLKKNGLEHRMLKLPKPGKPKVDPVAVKAAADAAAKASADTAIAEKATAEKASAEKASAEKASVDAAAAKAATPQVDAPTEEVKA